MTVAAVPLQRVEPVPLRRGDFGRVMQTGRRLQGRRMVIHVLRTDDGVRTGFVAGRRVGGAVVRNRARRVLKEAWRTVWPDVRGGLDLVFVARSNLPSVRTPEVAAEMAELLRAAGAIG